MRPGDQSHQDGKVDEYEKRFLDLDTIVARCRMRICRAHGRVVKALDPRSRSLGSIPVASVMSKTLGKF